MHLKHCVTYNLNQVRPTRPTHCDDFHSLVTSEGRPFKLKNYVLFTPHFPLKTRSSDWNLQTIFFDFEKLNFNELIYHQKIL